MPKLTEEQLNAIKSLPYYSNVKDLIPLYESGILSQDKFNEELLKERENYKPNPTSILSSEGIEMVLVEGGAFQVRNEVTVSDFYIGKFQITQAQYQAVMGTNPSHFKGDNLPVEQVSWFDAVEFCNKLSEMEGLQKCYSGSGNSFTCNFKASGYRLPTEAEWEYVARGGNRSRGYEYSGSNTVGDVAWYDDNSDSNTHPVGTKQPNELGIFDMSGNVWEWCWDRYTEGYRYRVVRGGSWDDGGCWCGVANRFPYDPDYRFSNFGFRVARTK